MKVTYYNCIILMFIIPSLQVPAREAKQVES